MVSKDGFEIKNLVFLNESDPITSLTVAFTIGNFQLDIAVIKDQP